MLVRMFSGEDICSTASVAAALLNSFSELSDWIMSTLIIGLSTNMSSIFLKFLETLDFDEILFSP